MTVTEGPNPVMQGRNVGPFPLPIGVTHGHVDNGLHLRRKTPLALLRSRLFTQQRSGDGCGPVSVEECVAPRRVQTEGPAGDAELDR